MAVFGFRMMEAMLLLTVFLGLVGLLLRRSLFLKVMGTGPGWRQHLRPKRRSA